MLPFDDYPDRGNKLLGLLRGSNCRREYGLKFMQLTRQRRCAYCEVDLTTNYEVWLTMVLDHAFPVSLCRRLEIPEEWCWDLSNLVLACGACNGFCNRYEPSFSMIRPLSIEDFYKLRDEMFTERKKLICERHGEERAFFQLKSWEEPNV